MAEFTEMYKKHIDKRIQSIVRDILSILNNSPVDHIIVDTNIDGGGLNNGWDLIICQSSIILSLVNFNGVEYRCYLWKEKGFYNPHAIFKEDGRKVQDDMMSYGYNLNDQFVKRYNSIRSKIKKAVDQAVYSKQKYLDRVRSLHKFYRDLPQDESLSVQNESDDGNVIDFGPSQPVIINDGGIAPTNVSINDDNVAPVMNTRYKYHFTKEERDKIIETLKMINSDLENICRQTKEPIFKSLYFPSSDYYEVWSLNMKNRAFGPSISLVCYRPKKWKFSIKVVDLAKHDWTLALDFIRGYPQLRKSLIDDKIEDTDKIATIEFVLQPTSNLREIEIKRCDGLTLGSINIGNNAFRLIGNNEIIMIDKSKQKIKVKQPKHN